MTEKQKEESILISSFMGYVIVDFSKKDLEYISSWNHQIPVYSKLMPLFKELIKSMDSWDYLYNYYYKVEKDYCKAVYTNDVKEGFRIITDALRHYKLYKKD